MHNLKQWVRSQLPMFLRDGEAQGGYEKFIAFLQAYYDFLETEGRVHNTLFRFNDLNDVDKTLDKFLENLLSSFSFAISPDFFKSKKDALKHFKEIHSIKGTPESYKLLFRFMFDEAIEILYPEEDIFKTSARRFEPKSYVSYTAEIPLNLEGRLTFVDNANFITTAITTIDINRNVYWAEYDLSTLKGNFTDASLIWADGSNSGTLIKTISSIDIVDSGTGYVFDDIFQLVVFNRKIILQVKEVTSTGSINRVIVVSQGYHEDAVSYTEENITDGTGSGAILGIHFDVNFIPDILTGDERHQPSGRSKLQDGFYYSPYTMTIKTGYDVSLWKDIVLNMIHPAGFALFSQILITSYYLSEYGATSSIQDEASTTIPVYNWYILDGILYVINVIKEQKKDFLFLILSNTRTNATQIENYFEINKFLAPPYEEGIAGTANVFRNNSTNEYETPIQYYFGSGETNPLYVETDFWKHQNFNIDTIADYQIDFKNTLHHIQPGSFILHKEKIEDVITIIIDASEVGNDQALFFLTDIPDLDAIIDVTESNIDEAAFNLNNQIILSAGLQELGLDQFNTLIGNVLITITANLQEVGNDTALFTVPGENLILTMNAHEDPDQALIEGELEGGEWTNIIGMLPGTGTLDAQEIGFDVAEVSGVVGIEGTLDAQEVGLDVAEVSGVIEDVGIEGTLDAQEVGLDVAEVGIILDGEWVYTEIGVIEDEDLG